MRSLDGWMDGWIKTETVRSPEARPFGQDPVPGKPLPQDQRQAGRPQRRAERQAPLRAGREFKGVGRRAGSGA